MAVDNVTVTQQVTNVTVTQPPANNVVITQPSPPNITIATGGLQGAIGPAPTLSSVIATNLIPGAAATGSFSGGPNAYVLNLGIPVGAKIWSGSGAASTSLGVQGDWYLDTATWNYYEKTAVSTWTLRLNLRGAQGIQGLTGPAPTMQIGTVTNATPGANPTVTVTGTNPYSLNFTQAITNWAIGTVTTVATGGSATASLGGTALNRTLNIGIPTGATGPAPNLATGTITQATAGTAGTASISGTNPNYLVNIGIPIANWTIGTVTTVATGSPATASLGGTALNPSLNIGIPIGATGPAPTMAGTVPVTPVGPTVNPTASITGTNPYTLNLSLPASFKPYFGDDATRTSGLGLQGDTYTVTTGATNLGNVYLKTSSTVWTLQGNIRGAAGTGNVSAGAGTIGNVTQYGAADGSLMSDGGFAASDIMRMSNTQTVAGAKTFSSVVTGAGFNSTTGNFRATTSVADVTNKQFNLLTNHYLIAEEDFTMLGGQSKNGANNMNFGGGYATYNSATNISFWTASDGITTTGTNRMLIDSTGLVTIYGGLTVGGTITGTHAGSGAALTGVVHTTGNETIAGLKTLSSALEISANVAGSETNSSNLIMSYAGGPTAYANSIRNSYSGTASTHSMAFYLKSNSVETNPLTFYADGRAIFNYTPIFNANTAINIGAVSPLAALHVGTTGITNAESIIMSYGPDVSYRAGFRTSWSGSAVNSNVITFHIRQGVDSTDRNVWTVQGDGKMGIGTLTPSTALDVAGTVNATAFTGAGSGITALNASNIGSGTVPIANIPTGTTGTTVALGNHNHDTVYVALTGNQTIAGVKTFSATPVFSTGLSSSGNIVTTTSALSTTLSGNSLVFNRASAASFIDQSGVGGNLTFRTSSAAALDTSALILAANGSATFASTLAVTGSAIISGGTLSLNNATSNIIKLGNATLAAPTLTSYSTGTRVVLHDNVGAGSAGYALGVEANYMWTAVANTANGFKWYGGTTLAATLTGTGALTLVGNLSLSTGASIVGGDTTANTLYINHASTAGTIAIGQNVTGGALWVGARQFNFIGITVSGVPTATATQTGDLMQFRKQSDSAVIARITADGVFTGSGAGLTGMTVSQISGAAPLASPTFTGTVSGITATMVGLGNVANLAQVDLVNAQTIAGIKTFSATPVFSSGATVTGTITATTFSGSGASLTSLPAGNLTGTVAQARLANNTQRFIFTTGSEARPTGTTYVEWVGPVTPTNWTSGDTWVNTA